MSVILLCALLGAVVGGLAAIVLTGPQRRHNRRVALLRAEAWRNYGEALRPRGEADECPVCVARHRFEKSDCERMATP